MLRYGDLIEFEAVESVIQLKEANDTNKAVSRLQTYVISNNMADKIIEIIENIQFDRLVDNKGMLIVGNYGTGKSHLMSVISAVAELPDASQYLRNSKVIEKAKEIEGKFKVVRAEFGSVTMSLRDIICKELERGLEKIGIDYSFPSSDQVTNNKDMFYEMIELFHEQYPDQGLLLVIDELLDYLRGRKEQELTLDLGFLREVGEVCSNSRFHFISGVQEMLFDNPKFSFVAESLRRVKERFNEIRIVREDIAFVVSERLLKKNEEQKALIREHLSKFTKLYNGLSEDMETYVNLFPIHPAYLETFEKVNIAEKRVVLQTISKEIKKLLEFEVPEESTGLISFDRYWQYIEDDSSLRSQDNVKLVMNKVETLKGCIQNSVKRQYKQMATQLIYALAVYRLTTDDLKTPIGLTSELLRDKLFISNQLMLEFEDEAADFLTTTIEAAMKEVMTAASFQFVSLNKNNGQYYIDVEKVTAVDDLIQQRGEGLANNQLDSYYFHVLKQATEVSDSTYVNGYKIWLHELPWEDRRVKRRGYLFFGAPNERSTAQPERDFYIYMLQPFEEPKFKDEQKEDEVFFRLTKKNDELIQLLRLYGGACEMYNDTTTNRHLYKPKMETYLKNLVKWFKENFVDAFEIVYRGRKANVLEHGLFLPSNPDTVLQIIDSVSQDLLCQWFEIKYNKYPSFRKLERSYITKENLHTYVKDAFDYLNGKKSNQGEAILNGLVLLDQSGKLLQRKSGYANWVLDLLDQKEHNQVLNYNELIEVINTVQGSPDQRLTKEFAMEPELLIVILAALIQSGELVVSVNGTTYEAMNFAEFIRLPIQDLTYFSHIKKPSGLPVSAVQALIELFGAVKVDFTDPNSIDFSIKQIITRAKEETNKTIEMIACVRSKFQIWDGQLFSQEEREEKIAKLESLSEFLQGLQVYQTRAKMVNLKYDVVRIAKEKEHLSELYRLQKLQQKINEYTKVADYLSKAKYIVSPDQDWMNNVDLALDNLSMALKNNEDCLQEVSDLERLKKQYIDYYMTLHQRVRLNATENKQKSALLRHPRYDALSTLSSRIPFLPSQMFEEWQTNLKSLRDCYSLTADKLAHTPECPFCKYNPREEEQKVKPSLTQLEDQLGELLDSWTEMLLTNFNDSVVKESIELLEEKEKKLIQDLIASKEFVLPIDLQLIYAINVILQGIHKEQIDLDHLAKVFGDGNPITVDEARSNFEKLLKGLIGSNETSRIRLTVKK